MDTRGVGTMDMEEELYAERAALRCVLRAHPEWTQAEVATHLGRSLSGSRHGPSDYVRPRRATPQ